MDAKPVKPIDGELRLPASLVEAWRRTVLELARLPKGMGRKTHTPQAMMDAVVRQETGEVGRLWTIFTQERGDLGRNLLGSKRSVVAYLLGFHLANAARAHLAITRAASRWAIADYIKRLNGKLVWHDLGCGGGAVGHAVADFAMTSGLPKALLEMHLSDNLGSLLDAARALFTHAGLGESTQTHKFPLEGMQLDRLIPAEGTALTGYSLGYVWNELKKNPSARSRIMQALEAHAKRQDDVLMVVLEPGIQEIARDAMELRDRLVAMGYVPLYPCPHAAGCPMLERTRDWCYSEGTWARPREILRLDQQLELDRSRVNGGFYVLASASLAAKLPRTEPAAAVVVGRPDKVQGVGYEYLMCTETAKLEKAPTRPYEQGTLRGLTRK